MCRTIQINALVDAHVHLRQDAMTKLIAQYSRCCSHVIAMPNTTPPIHDVDRIAYMQKQYQDAIGPGTVVHMTAKWLPRTTPADVIAAKNAGAIGFKLYPQGATTNSDDGIPYENFANFNSHQQIADVLGELERQDMVLMCHGEAPGFCMDREALFLPALGNVMYTYPKLRVSLEHITTEDGIAFVSRHADADYKILGTITLHHMMRTLDDVVGGKLHPNEFCMPINKRPHDRAAIFKAATSEKQCFALGSDSAPHLLINKYCRDGCAGVFSAPVLAQSLVELFLDDDCYESRQAMNKFCVENASKFYNFERSSRELTLEERPWTVPQVYGGVPVFRSGETIRWALVE